MRKIFIFLTLIIIFNLLCSCSEKEEYKRLRIIANSNTTVDVLEKNLIKDIIEESFKTKEINYSTLNAATVNDLLMKRLDSNLYTKLKIKECISYYPAKQYNGKFIPSGNYATILIEIDNAEGNNFWTLLYPEFFGFEFEESNEIEYRSYFYDKLS